MIRLPMLARQATASARRADLFVVASSSTLHSGRAIRVTSVRLLLVARSGYGSLAPSSRVE